MPIQIRRDTIGFPVTTNANNRASMYSYRRNWVRNDQVPNMVPHTWTGVSRVMDRIRPVDFESPEALFESNPNLFINGFSGLVGTPATFLEIVGLLVNAARHAAGGTRIALVQPILDGAMNYRQQRSVFGTHQAMQIRVGVLAHIAHVAGACSMTGSWSALWTVVRRLANYPAHYQVAQLADLSADVAPAPVRTAAPRPVPPVVTMTLGREIPADSDQSGTGGMVSHGPLGREYVARQDEGSIPMATVLKLIVEKRVSPETSRELAQVLEAALPADTRDAIYELLIADDLRA